MKGAFLLSYLNNIARIEGLLLSYSIKSHYQHRVTSILFLSPAGSCCFTAARNDCAIVGCILRPVPLWVFMWFPRPAALPKVRWRWHTRHCRRFRPWGPASSLLMDRPASASTIVWLCLSAWNSSLRFVIGKQRFPAR